MAGDRWVDSGLVTCPLPLHGVHHRALLLGLPPSYPFGRATVVIDEAPRLMLLIAGRGPLTRCSEPSSIQTTGGPTDRTTDQVLDLRGGPDLDTVLGRLR